MERNDFESNTPVEDDFYAALVGNGSPVADNSEQKPQDEFWAGFEAAKKAEAEAAAKIAAEEERKAAEKKAAEEEAAKKAEAEAARKAALEAARKAAEEAKLLAERAAAEAEAARKAEEETKKRIAEEAKKKAAEEEAARKATEEAAKKAAEEAERKAAEEAAKKAAEEEAAKKAAEEAAKKAEEDAKRAAEEVKAAKKASKKKADKPDKKLNKKSEKAGPVLEKGSEANEKKNALNMPAIIIVAVCCVAVIVLSYVATYILFKGGSVASMSGEEQKANVENEITSALQAADVGLDFSIADAKLSAASENSYVVFFREDYSLYKMTGNYSRAGLSNKEKVAEAAASKTSAENAELISDCLTSYYLNMKDIDSQTVTLNVKITDEDGKEYTVNKAVSVNVVSTSAPAGDTEGEAGGDAEAGGEAAE